MRGENQVLSYRHPAKSDRYLGLIDLDLCVIDGLISDFARRLLIWLNALAEYSVSGTGIHALCWLAAIPPNSILPTHKDLVRNIEFYWERNTIPLTGKLVSFDGWSSPMDIPDRTQAYLQLHRASFPSAYESSLPVVETGTSELSHEEVLRFLFNERNGTKWERVFNGEWQDYYASPSDADFGLLLKLGFYTNRDRQMMSD